MPFLICEFADAVLKMRLKLLRFLQYDDDDDDCRFVKRITQDASTVLFAVFKI